MAGRTFSDRFIAKGYGAPDEPYAIGVSRRTLLVIVSAAIVAFGIAFAAGSTTVTKPAVTVRLAPSTGSTSSPISVVAVTPVRGIPALHAAPTRRAVSHRSTAQRTPPAAVPVTGTAPAAPAVSPVSVVPSVPVTPAPPSVPTGGGTAPSGSSTSPAGGSASKGTGTSTGGDSGTGHGTGTVSGGG